MIQNDGSNSNENNTGNKPSISVKKSNKAIVTVVSLVVFVLVFLISRYMAKETVTNIATITNSPNKQELIDLAVQGAKQQQIFPSEVDAATTWTGITGTSTGIRYQYTLHDIDTSSLSNLSLKNSIAPAVCSNPDTRNLINEDISMEYSYNVKGTAQTYFFSVSKADCI